MLESFGARLRQHRQEQGIALGTIAEQSKIKGSLLEALERDDVSQWPSGIYRRAYIRAYAHAIGLDPDVVLREFLERYPDQAEIDAAAAIATLAENARGNGGPPTRLRYLVGSAIGSLARLTRGASAHDHHRVERTVAPAPPRPDVEMPPAPVESPMRADDTPIEIERLAAVEQAYQLHHVDDLVAQWPQPEAAAASAEAAAEPEPPMSMPTAESVATVDVTHQPVTATAGEPRVTAAQSASVDKMHIPGPDFQALAQLCTHFARVGSTDELQRLLKESARMLDASGLIVWVWDTQSGLLQAALAHGYSERMLAQLPGVRRDADNPTAAAFRSAETRTIPASDSINGALVVPLLTPEGCAGVLALELRNGGEQATAVRSAATIIGAMLAQLVGPARASEPEPKVDVDPTFETFAASIRREHARR
jgi:transcriptional regulator with XRE-family HTH domain